MRITELLEGKRFNDLDWVDHKGDKTEINFDLAEDLIYFMNHDDDIYRRHLYPSVVRCIEGARKKKTSPDMFADAVKESYKHYLKKFPVKELPFEINSKVFKETCEKLHEETCQHISDGKYKD